MKRATAAVQHALKHPAFAAFVGALQRHVARLPEDSHQAALVKVRGVLKRRGLLDKYVPLTRQYPAPTPTKESP